MVDETYAPKIKFGGREIGERCPVVIIAEIGINHEGSVETCARMIEEAAKAGADGMKLQTMDADENYMQNTESYAIFKNTGLSPEATARMFNLSRELGMEPFTTTGDAATFEWVERLEPAAHKISSGLLSNLPFIRHIAPIGRTLLMSTGMAETDKIDEAVAAVDGNCEFGLFQCTSIYPAPPETVNLSAISWLERHYGVPVGLSDHSIGPATPAYGVAAGARMIEKHFTLDPNRPSFDHQLSLDPGSFAEMVRRVREVEVMLGSASKELSSQEKANADRYHRILVTRREIGVGEVFGSHNLGLKRPQPGTQGLAPKYFETVIGRRAVRSLAPDQSVTADSVEGEL